MGRNWWFGDRRSTDVLGADLEVDLYALTGAIREAATMYHPPEGVDRRTIVAELNGELSFGDGVDDSDLLKPSASWSDNQYHLLNIFTLAYSRPGMAWFRSSVPNPEKATVIAKIIDSLDLLTPALAKQPNRVQEIARKIAHNAGMSIAGESPDVSIQQLQTYDSRVIAAENVGSTGMLPEEKKLIEEIEKLTAEASEAAMKAQASAAAAP